MILDDIMIKEKYDIVVIGAGIGGITTAALLARQGLSTLVIEQHYLPGGVCSTIKRRGVSMDAGAALLFGFAPGSESPHHYVMNILEEDIDMIHHDALYRMHFQHGKSVTFWRDFERYFAELTAAFPGKDDEFRGFYDECFKLYKAMNANPMPMSPDTVPPIHGLKMLITHPFRTRYMLKSMDQSVKSVLDKYVRDRDVEGFFDLLIASCYCTTTQETPALLGTAVICSTHDDEGGACYPAGGPQTLPNKLERALEKYGGQILYRKQVERILFEDNRAIGIRLDDGTIIHADHVVSNADVYQLYDKLIDDDLVPLERKEWVKKQIPSVSAVVVYLSVKDKAIPTGTHHIEAVIGDLKIVESNNYFTYIPSIDDPSVAPDGEHSISILCSAGDYDWPRPDDPRYQSDEYNKQKQLVADRAIDVLEKRLFPGLRKNILSIDIGTPSTIERYTLKSWGNIGGPKQMLGQHLFNRLGARTEFDRLYAVGDSCVMGEGVVSVTASAVGTANMVLEDRRMKIYTQRNFPKKHVHHVKGAKRGPLPPEGQHLTVEQAQRLALECQWCEDPTCIANCPAGVDIPGFIRRIEAGNFAGAARLIREQNPLAELCGKACPAENLCMSTCYRKEYANEPVRINDLQAWTCQQAGQAGWPEQVDRSLGKTVAVVGAGPAGLSCGYYLARLGYDVHMFDPNPGGVPAAAVPDFRVPAGSVEREVSTILAQKNIVLNKKGLGAELTLDQLEKEYEAVFLACGTGEGKIIDIEGLDSGLAIDAMSYLKACKNKTEQPLKGKVVVIGGGSVASDAALMAKYQGAENVTLVCMETQETMPCLIGERIELESEGINIQSGWAPSRVEGQELVLSGCDSVTNEAGEFAPVLDTNRSHTVQFDQIIMAVGQQIEGNLRETLLNEFPGLEIEVNENTQKVMSREKLFAGGDFISGSKTIVDAVADGRRAAVAINLQLSED